RDARSEQPVADKSGLISLGVEGADEQDGHGPDSRGACVPSECTAAENDSTRVDERTTRRGSPVKTRRGEPPEHTAATEKKMEEKQSRETSTPQSAVVTYHILCVGNHTTMLPPDPTSHTDVRK